MCGIAGFYGFRNDDLSKKFSHELEHRGPDGEGFYIEDNVTLLNRRLAIIDRKGGDQPIYNEDKSIAIVYVGEIYNFQEQREELLNLGHTFRTKSDTEVVIHAYEQWGEKSFDRHNGMFTFALYDKKKEKLLLVRDHFGIKPLYFVLISTDSVEKRLVFSSEIKPIINSGLIKKKPNDRIIYRYLRYRIHDDQRETFFAGVNRLMPGELLEVSSKKLKVRNYTRLKVHLGHPSGVQAQNLSEKEIDIFKSKLIEAVRLRLISEVPVGTCLSGGLDSSTVVTIVNKLLQEKVKEAESVGRVQNTFSAVFPHSSNDEEKYIDEVVKSVKSKVHKVNPKPEEFFREIEEFIRTQEEPTISTGPYAQYRVMQMAHKKVTVLLDGQASDEMMAGYDPYLFVYVRQLWNEKKLGLLVQQLVGFRDIFMNVLISRLINIIGRKKNVSPLQILKKSFAEKFEEEKFVVINNNLKKRLIEDIFSNSLQSLLRYEDRNAMRYSIEGRVPFLDFNLLRYLFSLPDEAIIGKGWNKYILRQAIEGLVPELIRQRRNKIGFTTPEQEWFLRMKNKIYSLFLSESFANRKYFNQQEVLKAFQKFIEGKNDDTMLFWRLLNVEIWMRVFFDPSSHKVHKVVKSIKTEFEQNEGKKLEIEVDLSRHPESRNPTSLKLRWASKFGTSFISGSDSKKQMLNQVQHDKYATFLRFPIRTELFKKGDNVEEKIAKKIKQVLDQVRDNPQIKVDAGWFVVISEKIVAIAQGRSYFIWDIHPSFFAKTLSNYVTKTPYGIGLGSPWTMQLAIDEVGLPKILLATIVAAITKPLGVKGLFYKIAGREAAAIDGPTEYSLYPSNVSAKLGPKDPQKVAREIHNFLISNFPASLVGRQFPISNKISNLKSQNSKTMNYELRTTNFLGVAIIDANDLGRTVLGNSTNLPNGLVEKIFRDNPMGQADEQTPLVIVFQRGH